MLCVSQKIERNHWCPYLGFFPKSLNSVGVSSDKCVTIGTVVVSIFARIHTVRDADAGPAAETEINESVTTCD